MNDVSMSFMSDAESLAISIQFESSEHNPLKKILAVCLLTTTM